MVLSLSTGRSLVPPLSQGRGGLSPLDFDPVRLPKPVFSTSASLEEEPVAIHHALDELLAVRAGELSLKRLPVGVRHAGEARAALGEPFQKRLKLGASALTDRIIGHGLSFRH